MAGRRYVEGILAALLVMTVTVGSIWSGAWRYVGRIFCAVWEDVRREGALQEGQLSAYEETAAAFTEALPFRRPLVDLNGTLAGILNLRELYRDDGGMVLDNGYVVGVYPYTSLDYELQQTAGLKEYLDSRGISLLYVNEPTKYADDALIAEEMGQRSYVNDNVDRFLAGLRERGISYIDLRDTIVERGIDCFSLFYRTDHHWTAEAGKLAAEAIAAELNDRYGYGIDLSLYAPDRFLYRGYQESWLGEQGRKLGAPFVGLDDFTLVLPEYDTMFTVTYGGGEMTGSFDEVLVDQSFYLPEKNEDIYNAPSWHYSYMGHYFYGGKYEEDGIYYVNGAKVVNHKVQDGKRILVLGDSYEQTMLPFLALGVSEIQCLVLRDYGGSLREYIDSHDIDTVVIAYAAFMLGAHDDVSSANYGMFGFE